LQIVNGYVCQTCCDVAAAKAGKDPAHPNAPPGQAGKPGNSGAAPNDGPAGAAQSGVGNRPAVTFGGALTPFNNGPPNGQPTQPSPSNSPAYSGGLINLSA